MIIAINYADEKFRKSQKFNTHRMKTVGKADDVIEYTPESIDKEFASENKGILSEKRGGGYWLWKPYVILDALKKINSDDYVVYTDSGVVILKPISFLINLMDKNDQNIMCFTGGKHLKECYYTKRDAFILTGCDNDIDIYDTPQYCGGYIVIRKNKDSLNLVKQWLQFATDRRIITDDPNVMGKENYPGFIDHRHDQSIWSLVCKKNHIIPFRNPSQYGEDASLFFDEVNARSRFPQMFDVHRQNNIGNWFYWKYYHARMKFANRHDIKNK